MSIPPGEAAVEPGVERSNTPGKTQGRPFYSFVGVEICSSSSHQQRQLEHTVRLESLFQEEAELGTLISSSSGGIKT